MIKGIGIDLVDVDRFRQTENKQEILNQFLTAKEIGEQDSLSNNDIYWCRLFALKEAVLKALRVGLHYGSYWHDIIITKKVSVCLSRHLKKLMKSSNQVSADYSCSRRYLVGITCVHE